MWKRINSEVKKIEKNYKVNENIENIFHYIFESNQEKKYLQKKNYVFDGFSYFRI